MFKPFRFTPRRHLVNNDHYVIVRGSPGLLADRRFHPDSIVVLVSFRGSCSLAGDLCWAAGAFLLHRSRMRRHSVSVEFSRETHRDCFGIDQAKIARLDLTSVRRLISRPLFHARNCIAVIES